MKITHTENVSKLRSMAYPLLTDFADAVYWQSKGDDTKMNEYLAKCEEVKLKYPKLVDKE